MSKVIILGGHGKVALALTPKLVALGHHVASAVHRESQFDEIRALGAEPTLFDLEQAGIDDLVDLVTGYDAIVWSAGAGGGSPERTYRIDRDAAVYAVQAAIIAQVRRYITVSWSGSRLNHGIPQSDSFFPYAQSKAIADSVLRDSDLDWTVLGPVRLTDEPGTGGLAAATQNGAVSRDDVARAVVAVLDEPKAVRQTIRFQNGSVPVAEYVRDAGTAR